MSALLELAARCEAATGPDLELDKAIAIANGWCLHPTERQRNDSAQSDTGYTCLDCGADSWGNTGPTGQKRSAPLPAYTASLDAAMTLVPEGFDWIIGRTNDGLTIHACCGDRDMRFGNTPALALCAAALRARATGEQP